MNAHFFGITQNPASSNHQRLACLQQLGVKVQAHNTSVFGKKQSLYTRVRWKLTPAAFSEHEIRSYNEDILHACVGAAPDFLWFEWPLRMERRTLMLIRERWPQSLLICFQDDNPFGDRKKDESIWCRFKENIPLYDVHLVKRLSDIEEYSKRGAKRVQLFQHGVFESIFHPDDRPIAQRNPQIPVSFVGTAHDHRIGFIGDLISRYHVPLHVFGGGWNRTWIGWRYASHFSRDTYSEEYVKIIWNSKISLAFVSSSNRDEYTMRTFEIPGSGGFFLAERTPKHQELYEEGKEAEYFSSTEECVDKINFYLNNDEARRRIAMAGYERCIRSDYRLVSRMREALDQLFP
jgi:spore maturation protein CgeB